MFSGSSDQSVHAHNIHVSCVAEGTEVLDESLKLGGFLSPGSFTSDPLSREAHVHVCALR